MHEPTGWMLTEFQAAVAAGIWLLVVLLHGIWRSAIRPDPDEIRPSGPS